jgi:hypothetical protein
MSKTKATLQAEFDEALNKWFKLRVQLNNAERNHVIAQGRELQAFYDCEQLQSALDAERGKL